MHACFARGSWYLSDLFGQIRQTKCYNTNNRTGSTRQLVLQKGGPTKDNFFVFRMFWVVPRRPAVAQKFRMADFPMIIPGLPSSIASSPMGPPPAQSAAPKPKAPSKELIREAEEKRGKRRSDEHQLHDAMLANIFKAVYEDTVPESYAGIYSSGKKDRVGCEWSSSPGCLLKSTVPAFSSSSKVWGPTKQRPKEIGEVSEHFS